MKNLLAASLLAISCTACGSSISSGAGDAVPSIPDPELRAPGEAPAVATVSSITPDSGSSKTRWTLSGSNLAGVDGVRFGGSWATIESVTDTEIVVVDAFGARESMGVLDVTFTKDGETRTAGSVFGYPDGTLRESGNEGRVWYRTSWIAATESRIYVVDSTRGVYGVNRETDTVSRIAKNGTSGIEVATAVFVSPGNELFVTDETSQGNRRLLRNDGAQFVPFAVLAEPIVDLTFDATGAIYIVGSQSVRKFLADGTEVLSFQPVIPDQIGGGFVQNGALYLTQRWTGTIVAVDATWGAVTDLAISGLSTPGAISGDGDVLFVADDAGVHTVDIHGTVAPFSSAVLPFATWSINRLVVAGASVLVSDPSSTNVMDVGAQETASIAAGGIGSTYAMAHAGGALVVSSYDSCFDATAGSEHPAGVMYALTAGGARMIRKDLCAVSGITATADGAAIVYTSVSASGALAEVGRLELDGTRTVIATQEDGLRFPLSAVEDAAGNLYVAEADYAESRGTVARITADGAVESEWASSANVSGYAWAMAITGDALVLSEAGSTGIFTVSLANGGETAMVAGSEELYPAIDGVAVDAAGTIIVSDAMTGSVRHLDAQNSTVTTVQVLEGAGSIDVNAATGDVEMLDIGGAGARFHGIMP